MPKKGNVARLKMRRFAGNRFSNQERRDNGDVITEVTSRPGASARKLGPEVRSPVSDAQDTDSVSYRIIDFSSLVNNISEHLCCKLCHGNVKLTESSIFGLASTFCLLCENCDFKHNFKNSPSNNNRVIERNRRIVYAISKSQSSLHQCTTTSTFMTIGSRNQKLFGVDQTSPAYTRVSRIMLAAMV